MKKPTLQTIPLDMILHIGKYLLPIRKSHLRDVNQVTLAAILEDREMLEHFIERHTDQNEISPQVALSGNLQVLKWTIKKMKCPMNYRTCRAAAEGGHLEILKYLVVAGTDRHVKLQLKVGI